MRDIPTNSLKPETEFIDLYKTGEWERNGHALAFKIRISVIIGIKSVTRCLPTLYANRTLWSDCTDTDVFVCNQAESNDIEIFKFESPRRRP